MGRVEDQLLWAHDVKGEFSVKQLSKLLLEGEGDDSIFAFNRIWKLKVPPKVCNFLWLLAIDRVPTKDFLIKRGVKIQAILNVCPWCNRELERADHLFFKLVNNFEEFYSSCFKVKFVGSCKSLWLIAITASCWSIWLVRNKIVFENKVLSMATLIFHSKMRALLWVRAAFNECIIQERLWWFCPYKCSLSKSGSRGWCYPSHGWLKFNVSGTASESASGYGGVMRDKESSIRALFSGPCWKGGSLIVEMGSRVVYNWILDKKKKPWSKQAIFADLERRIACVGKISFLIANLNKNSKLDV
ncbi:hypothetical protein ES332_A12G046300v1 [Gossypium tomentosum]|uniref:Reverse transcriptase zinc-binding domain-containing protein n=1 Tax=Gossypium tomentosum TaxID=34277 RepID=A0A5D2MTM1_GOSTO|nr:hypothetical protein ES332_A12G046300v1 [Gossypium tomentosum]